MSHSIEAVRKYSRKQRRRGMCSSCKTRKPTPNHKTCLECRRRVKRWTHGITWCVACCAYDTCERTRTKVAA